MRTTADTAMHKHPALLLGAIFAISLASADASSVKGVCVSNCNIAPPPTVQKPEEDRPLTEEEQVQALFDSVEGLMAMNKWNDALREVDEILAMQPGNSQALTLRNQIQAKLGGGLSGAESRVGRELKSVEQHSITAETLRKEASSTEARRGFDTPGKASGTLVLPQVSGKKPVASTTLAARVPAAARQDPEVKNALAWHEQLEKTKLETKQKIADAQQQQKAGTGDKTVLSAHIQTLTNQLKDTETQQAKTEQTLKKRVKDLGLTWNEAAPQTQP